MTRADITSKEHNSYFEIYIKQAGNANLFSTLEQSELDTIAFFKSLDKQKHTYSYAEGKWTILEILQHIIDTERIFQYRAFRYSRHDSTPLPGFEQDDYVVPSRANTKPLSQLIEEYTCVRQSSLALFNSITTEDLCFIGTGSNSPMSARAILAILIGHEKHHISIIKTRYL